MTRLKLLIALGVAGLLLSATPVRAEHGAEGTITVFGKEAACSAEEDKADGKCTWKATDPNSWTGRGPFTVTWKVGAETKKFTCKPGESCESPDDKDPIPKGAVVTTDGTGGGTFAAGDADQHDNE